MGLVIALVPSLATNNLGFPSDFVSAIRILLIGILIVGICALIFLIKQKIKLNKSINKYNHTVDDNYSKITNNMSDYSQYMGTIASYSRAKSYLDLSKRKIYFGKEEHYSKYRYISSINKMLAGIRTWSKAHYIDVDFDSSPAMVLTKSDVYRMINRNELYNLHTDEVFTLKINDSGAEISSPFEFVKGIEISREELYDDESA